jgi:esterase/lipase superfamily enzyme
MRREYHRWNSPALGRDMELLLFGHGGARLLAFPPAGGRFYDWENHGLIHALHEHLEQGWLQVCCVDSVDSEAWFDERLHPIDRARRNDRYDASLLYEVLPFTKQHNANPFLITAGVNFGAYHAVNFAFRYPREAGRVLAMGGICDIRWRAHGVDNDLIYFHNPVEYVANENEPARLEALRRMDIILAVGEHEHTLPVAQRLSAVLWDKGIGNALRVWHGDAHNWDCWRRMLLLYVGGHD